jgi:hypothetical protein
MIWSEYKAPYNGCQGARKHNMSISFACSGLAVCGRLGDFEGAPYHGIIIGTKRLGGLCLRAPGGAFGVPGSRGSSPP